MKKTIGSFALVCMLGTGLLLSGCGSSGSSPAVGGKVVKGPVEGATVLTACIDAADQISLAVPTDGTERTSNASGLFRLPVPPAASCADEHNQGKACLWHLSSGDGDPEVRKLGCLENGASIRVQHPPAPAAGEGGSSGLEARHLQGAVQNAEVLMHLRQ